LDIVFIDHLYTPHGTAFYRSLTHTRTSVLSLLYIPLAVSWQWLLPREILQLLWSCRCPLINTPHLNSQLQLSTNCSLGTPELDCRISTNYSLQPFCTNRIENTVSNNTPIVTDVFTYPFLRNRLQKPVVLLLLTCVLRALANNCCCLQNHCLAMGLYVTIYTCFIIVQSQFVGRRENFLTSYDSYARSANKRTELIYATYKQLISFLHETSPYGP
jgi:hypothetical protein